MNAADIQRAYVDLGYKQGWTFLLCPEARLDDARVAIVGLNPAGTYEGDGQWDCPEGNVFYTQRSANEDRDYSPIQHQIHA